MKADNQTMDRQIPVSEQRKRKIRKAVIGVAVAVAVLSIGAWLGSQMMPTLELIFKVFLKGTLLSALYLYHKFLGTRLWILQH